MGGAVPYVPVPLSPDQRQGIISGFQRLTDGMDEEILLGLIVNDTSLYRDYLSIFERVALDRLLSDNRELVRRISFAQLLELVGEGRPDLHSTIVADGGRQWFWRQWQELRGAVL